MICKAAVAAVPSRMKSLASVLLELLSQRTIHCVLFALIHSGPLQKIQKKDTSPFLCYALNSTTGTTNFFLLQTADLCTSAVLWSTFQNQNSKMLDHNLLLAENRESHALTRVISLPNFNWLPTGASHLFVSRKGTLFSLHLGSPVADNSSKQ